MKYALLIGIVMIFSRSTSLSGMNKKAPVDRQDADIGYTLIIKSEKLPAEVISSDTSRVNKTLTFHSRTNPQTAVYMHSSIVTYEITHNNQTLYPPAFYHYYQGSDNQIFTVAHIPYLNKQ